MQISVIIPVYNAEKYLNEAISSVLIQKEVNEILLVDDGSIDESYEICTHFAEKYTRVKLLTHPGHQNLGPSASRNLGINNATNEWVAFLDADDLFLPDRFQECIEKINKNPDLQFLHGAAQFFSNAQVEGKTYKTDLIYFDCNKHGYKAFEAFFMSHGGWSTLNACVFHRSCFTIVGLFDENLLLNQDTDFILRVIRDCKTLKLSNKIIAMARHHNQRRTNNERLVKEYKQLFYQKWFKEFLIGNWSKKLNRSFLNRYIQYTFSGISTSKSKIKRILLKLIYSAKIIIAYPIILKKIF